MNRGPIRELAEVLEERFARNYFCLPPVTKVENHQLTTKCRRVVYPPTSTTTSDNKKKKDRENTPRPF